MGKIIQVEFNKKEPIEKVLDTVKIEVDENGFMDIPVVIQDSGGNRPEELSIVGVGVYGGDSFNKQTVANLNEEDNKFSYFLATAKIKVLPGMKKWTNDLVTKDMTNTVMYSITDKAAKGFIPDKER